jgi:uncharacterized protein YxeA
MKTIAVILLIVLVVGIGQILYLRKAHSTFENYYTFRGCQELIQKTDTYGTCRLMSGQVIKIILYDGKWYLDGDLPWACVGKLCFGI